MSINGAVMSNAMIGEKKIINFVLSGEFEKCGLRGIGR
jgi:hypothetical protein